MGVTDGEPLGLDAAATSALGRVAAQRAQTLAGAVRAADLAGRPDSLGSGARPWPRTPAVTSTASSAAAGAAASGEPGLDPADPLGLSAKQAPKAETPKTANPPGAAKPGTPKPGTPKPAAPARPRRLEAAAVPASAEPAAPASTARATPAAERPAHRDEPAEAAAAGPTTPDQPSIDEPSARPRPPQRPTWYRQTPAEPPARAEPDPPDGDASAARSGSADPASPAGQAGQSGSTTQAAPPADAKAEPAARDTTGQVTDGHQQPSAKPAPPKSPEPGAATSRSRAQPIRPQPGEATPWTPAVAGGGSAGRDQPAARAQPPRPPVAPPTERAQPHSHQHRRPASEPAAAARPAQPRVERTEPADREDTPLAVVSDGRRRRFSGRALAAVAVTAGVLGGLVGSGFATWLAPRDSGSGAGGLVVSATVPVTGAGSVADAAAKALPSVVTVQVQGHDGSTGAGVIIRADGYILTNAHVIAAAAGDGKIVVSRYQDVTQLPAHLVGEDSKTDLAVIKIDDGGSLPAATLGQSGPLRVGDPVIAIGAPLGLSGTVTTGIVSALDRSPTEPVAGGATTVLSGAIQTDAAINPGSSGGPLLDALGQVVGINTAIGAVPGAPGGQDGQTGSIGVGFAIPIDYARSIAQEIIQTGHATHPYLGVSADTVTAAAAASSGRVPGALIRDLDQGGPAASAGLRVGDVVTKIDGKAVATADQLLETARLHHVGDRLLVSYVRAGHTATTQVTLAEQQS
ncbi:trypsin-like peptidase domain-containing protein [Pseudofrankia sp. DC12]|uniref:S1C family serine protease n=1 Tax=Pseudofrankia sp. DC12 TaxID=683315 RepID=UPI001E284E59|nr:trypsin-like peptidase domain-containing protein [Pseudofrankia sp. DC12]